MAADRNRAPRASERYERAEVGLDDAWDRLCRSSRDELYRGACLLVGAHDAEEVVQEAFERAMRERDRKQWNVTDYTPDAARRTLLARSAAGERWTLTFLRASAGPSWHGGVDAEVHLDRTLADRSVITTDGKTALSCIDTAVYVLSLGSR